MADGALDPGEAQEGLERTLADLRLMADVSAALVSSLDAGDVLGRLARLAVPALADWCAAYLVADGVSRVAVVHRDPDVEPPSGAEGPMPSPDPLSENPVERVLAGDGPLLADQGSAPTSDLARAHRELTDALGLHTEVLVPLQARRRVLGALSLVRAAPDRPFTDDDLQLVGDIAHHAALALDNARLYAAQRDAAQRLQRALLPELPSLGRLQLAARYAPAQEGAEVGGDWYDAFVLPDGAPTLTVGDVSGHDLTAAVQMSRLQSMLRTLAWEHREPPSAIMRRLDGLVQYYSEHTATAVYGRLEGADGGPLVFRWTNAGHYPPLLVAGDGATRFLDDDGDVLLGTGADPERRDIVTELPRGSTLLIYTDGLVERRGEDVDRGMVRLRQQAAQAAGEPPGALCDGLLEHTPEPAEDDVVLLAVRVP
ncbi:GAF domain-containing SpoIIE family protein phosphatase [Streptomonospora arabica]|uniref:GAF domain-containing SpoIIE family protein phosphatase n=1 Tax=Streptomonospora arabica TaxID=412417 RepID=A0ABV9SKS0_9ACTN